MVNTFTPGPDDQIGYGRSGYMVALHQDEAGSQWLYGKEPDGEWAVQRQATAADLSAFATLRAQPGSYSVEAHVREP